MLESIRKDKVLLLLREAGEAILEVYKSGDLEIQNKSDDTPVTKADYLSNRIICKGLAQLTPGIPIISEEMEPADYQERRNWEWAWVLDPLDGTREFIRKNGQFCINLALLHHSKVVMGFIHAPIGNYTYYAKKGAGAWRISEDQEMRLPHQKTKTAYLVLRSYSHFSEREATWASKMEERYPLEITPQGSALKFGLIAEGKGDLYPKKGPTCEWDTAPGQLLLEEVGGRLINWEGYPLQYNKPDLKNPWFLAMGPRISNPQDWFID